MQSHSDKISIALATYNGAVFIDALLASLVAQTHQSFELVISDDGSSDDTLAIIHRYMERMDIKILADGRKRGILRNFENALNGCSSDYIALCDQDDVWAPEKLALTLDATKQLESAFEQNRPVLVFSDLEIVDQSLNRIDASFFHHTNKSAQAHNFEDFLLGNHVPGCAMFFNRALLNVALPFPAVDIHDWWLIQVAALKGCLGFIERPLVKYRQHSGNSIGLGTKLGILGHVARASLQPIQIVRRLSSKIDLQSKSARKNFIVLGERFSTDVAKNNAYQFLLTRGWLSVFLHFVKVKHGFRLIELMIMLRKMRES